MIVNLKKNMKDIFIQNREEIYNVRLNKLVEIRVCTLTCNENYLGSCHQEKYIPLEQ
jgi:hypothetical protein